MGILEGVVKGVLEGSVGGLEGGLLTFSITPEDIYSTFFL